MVDDDPQSAEIAEAVFSRSAAGQRPVHPRATKVMSDSIECCAVAAVPQSVCTVTVDDYVPLRWRSYEGSLGGRLVRFGNFRTSLLEIVVESDSMLVRGFTLTLADRQHWPLPREPRRLVEGLPIMSVAAGFVGQPGLERMDLHQEFSVGWGEDFVEIDLGDLEKASHVVACGAVTFHVAGGRLRGLCVDGLTRAQVAQCVAACGSLTPVAHHRTVI